MPKTEQNFTMGIKIRWTLASEENWYATHRFSGKLWVISGLILLVSVFVPEAVSAYVLFAVLIVSVTLPILYSFLYYKKQVKEGNPPKKAVVDYKNFKGNSKVSITLGIIILVLVVMLL